MILGFNKDKSFILGNALCVDKGSDQIIARIGCSKVFSVALKHVFTVGIFNDTVYVIALADLVSDSLGIDHIL